MGASQKRGSIAEAASEPLKRTQGTLQEGNEANEVWKRTFKFCSKQKLSGKFSRTP